MVAPGSLTSETMSEIRDALIEAETVLQEDLGDTFTADGVTGTFPCVLDVQEFGDEQTTAGNRTSATATLSFLLSEDYTPETGHTVTADGMEWAVDRVQKTAVKWILSLISKDE
jgi:hypothetical protein